jgi:hypothetical protein
MHRELETQAVRFVDMLIKHSHEPMQLLLKNFFFRYSAFNIINNILILITYRMSLCISKSEMC